MNEERKTSIIWYLFPLLLGIFGGIIGYLLLKGRDQKTAKNVLYVGIGTLVFGFIILAAIPTPPPADTNIPAPATPAATPTATPISPEKSIELPESFESGRYVVLWNNGAMRFHIYRYPGGTFNYEWIGKTGETSSFSSSYNVTTLRRKLVITYPNGTIEDLSDTLYPPEIEDCLELSTEPKYWICKQNDKYELAYEVHDSSTTLSTHGKDYYVLMNGTKFVDFDRVSSNTFTEVYVFGTDNERFDGIIQIGWDQMSIEGSVPTRFSTEEPDTVSITVQKKRKGDGELAVVIYDPVHKQILNHGSTTASYGVVRLVA